MIQSGILLVLAIGRNAKIVKRLTPQAETSVRGIVALGPQGRSQDPKEISGRILQDVVP